MEIETLDGMRLAQRSWARRPVGARLVIVRELRFRMAGCARELSATVPVHLPGALHRTVADTMVSEVLPLIEACRFLEREAEGILATRRLGRRGRPVWLAGVASEVERAPWGVVLVIAPANYPLFLAGVQAVQALVAGNAVLWKPALGTEAAAQALGRLLAESGLPEGLLTVLDAGARAATEAISARVDYAILTGSAETGKAVLRQLAETVTPATMELSGCDAVFVLPGADVGRAIAAIGFGMRFNGSATCMAPRRLFLVGLSEAPAAEFEGRLVDTLGKLERAPLPEKTRGVLGELVEDARAQGADVLLDGSAGVTLIGRATTSLRAMQADIFAPMLGVMRCADAEEALAANAACPYALTAAIFGPEGEARALASELRAGNVLLNDLIVPTADPRIAFGGRGHSGFGVTRGQEGLLAMTTPRTIQVQRSQSLRAYAKTGEAHLEFFAGLTAMLHGRGIGTRWAGLKQAMRAGRDLK